MEYAPTPMPKRTRRPLTRALLALLCTAGKNLSDFAIFLQDTQRYQAAYVTGGKANVMELKRLRDARSARQALRNLQRQRYVTARRIGQRLMVSLTPKGRLANLARELAQGFPLPQGVYVAVAFDIPVTENAARRRFRLLLRQAGFIRLQQSLWLSSSDIYAGITNYVKRCKLERWVNVCRVFDLLTAPRQTRFRN